MDFNFQRDVEMIRRMVNALPYGHASYFPRFFHEDYLGFQHFFNDPLFDHIFCMQHDDRQRRNNPRQSRNLARNLAVLEQLLNQQASEFQGQRRNPNNRHQSRINITLQPPTNQITPHHRQRESSSSNDTNSVCDCTESVANDIEICAICREKFKERDTIRQLPCEHLFHPDCLRPWLQRRSTCPTCRQHL